MSRKNILRKRNKIKQDKTSKTERYQLSRRNKLERRKKINQDRTSRQRINS